MLSSVLTSKRAIEVNIAIMRTFTMLRKMLLLQKDIIHEITQIKRHISGQDSNITLIFEYLKQFEEARAKELAQKERSLIGYKSGKS